jgi:hypothetical protein
MHNIVHPFAHIVMDMSYLLFRYQMISINTTTVLCLVYYSILMNRLFFAETMYILRRNQYFCTSSSLSVRKNSKNLWWIQSIQIINWILQVLNTSIHMLLLLVVKMFLYHVLCMHAPSRVTHWILHSSTNSIYFRLSQPGRILGSGILT